MNTKTRALVRPSRQKHWLVPVALGLIVVFTALHYLTDTHAVEYHNLYRRLYYLPILIASFSHGLRGGLLAAVLTSLAYIPHAFFSEHRDPSPDVDKMLEIGLYFVVGGLTGWLVGRQEKVVRELRQTLEAKNHMERQLVRAGRLSALGQLASGLAHEIRNPLASILGAAEAITSDLGPEHRKHRIGQVLHKEIHRLRSVVDDFLAFARQRPLEHGEVDLRRCVEEVLGLTAGSHLPGAERVEIDATLEPAPSMSMVVRGDAGQIVQVLVNVLLNAFQAIKRVNAGGGGRIRFHLRAVEVGQRPYLQLGVEDSGEGIVAEELEEVFNPFYTTRSEGTGLGLSISNRIMEAHGGFIDIESAPGRTVVWLAFPKEGGEGA